jgi:hypothetical protein
VGSRLSWDPQFAAAARHLTRDTLRDRKLASLASDAEIIVGELAVNAVTRSAGLKADVRVVRRPWACAIDTGTNEPICAVLDPSTQHQCCNSRQHGILRP